MKNELILIENVERRLKEAREPPIFPLSPTHRKELRNLRDTNVGNLKERLRTIKQLKKEEYAKKHTGRIAKEINNQQKICDKLNKDWQIRIIKIQQLLQERQEMEESFDITYFTKENDYSDICNLRKIEESKREFRFEKKEVVKRIAEEEFEEKYGDKFKAVQEKIDDIITKYEEAINFGDLEIVKALYYMMKTADKFFEKVNTLEV